MTTPPPPPLLLLLGWCVHVHENAQENQTANTNASTHSRTRKQAPPPREPQQLEGPRRNAHRTITTALTISLDARTRARPYCATGKTVDTCSTTWMIAHHPPHRRRRTTADIPHRNRITKRTHARTHAPAPPCAAAWPRAPPPPWARSSARSLRNAGAPAARAAPPPRPPAPRARTEKRRFRHRRFPHRC